MTKTSPAGLPVLISVIWPIRASASSYLVFDNVYRFCFQSHKGALSLFASKRPVWTGAGVEMEQRTTMFPVPGSDDDQSP